MNYQIYQIPTSYFSRKNMENQSSGFQHGVLTKRPNGVKLERFPSSGSQVKEWMLMILTGSGSFSMVGVIWLSSVSLQWCTVGICLVVEWDPTGPKKPTLGMIAADCRERKGSPHRHSEFKSSNLRPHSSHFVHILFTFCSNLFNICSPSHFEFLIDLSGFHPYRGAYHVSKGSTLRWTFRVKDHDIGFAARIAQESWWLVDELDELDENPRDWVVQQPFFASRSFFVNQQGGLESAQIGLRWSRQEKNGKPKGHKLSPKSLLWMGLKPFWYGSSLWHWVSRSIENPIEIPATPMKITLKSHQILLKSQ